MQAGELEDLRDERVGELERGLPLAADGELHGAAGGRALRDRNRRAAGPARNVSRIPRPKAAGQEASGPIVDSWRLSTSAASRRTTAGPVIVTGVGGRLACGSRLGNWVIVTTRAADGTRSEPGRGGCQLTWASTRITVCPLPPPATSTTRSRAFSTPGIGDSENVRSQDGGPKSASPGVKRRGRCACSQASTACDWPGTRQKDTSSTSVVETTVVIGTLSASGAFGNRSAPGGTANAFKMAAASATARSRGVGDTAVTDPAAVCVAAQPAMAAQAASRTVVPGAHRTWGRIPVGRPAEHRGSASSNRPIVSAFPEAAGLVPGPRGTAGNGEPAATRVGKTDAQCSSKRPPEQVVTL